MYKIYSTEGFIFRSAERGEADCSYIILTKDFGLIRAEGKGVRKLESKLRYFLQDFSLINLSLVRGRGKWRITSGSLIKNIFSDLRAETDILALVSRVVALISRLVQGEEKNDPLFEHFKSAVLFLSGIRPHGMTLKNTEYLFVLRILHSLGYLGSVPDLSAFTASAMFESELLIKMEELKHQAIFTINKSLKESHL